VEAASDDMDASDFIRQSAQLPEQDGIAEDGF
jgi:hypothetical protein